MLTVWQDDFKETLIEKYGSTKGKQLYKKYENAFPSSYYEENSLNGAMLDINQIEDLTEEAPFHIDFYISTDELLHIRIFQFKDHIPLSDVLPILENMHLRVLRENPHRLYFDNYAVWINDFAVQTIDNQPFEINNITDFFEETFIQTYFGNNENDGFNRLVLRAQLSCRQITILRAYAKYLKQIGIRFSQTYIEKTLANNAQITKELVQLFLLKFDPATHTKNNEHINQLQSKITQLLDTVISLDEDRILRYFLELINATVRTNYFVKQPDGQPKEALSFKFNCKDVPDLPLPNPLYEIFVYSPRFEAIHLRAAKVARGGLRLSDRPEDFRTEVLGLMKAQKVKNAVIVPSGAKGGFVLKQLPSQANREMVMKEAIYCYKKFIRSLLDVTDNLKQGKVIKPQNVVCYDDNDPYLVVAADKGTATFSDIANEISHEYEFWLGDGFASGGSQGYDHKKMGITAKGAWESIKRHFVELDIDVEEKDFTVVGIGDMSGDVFGNGMLYTPHIKLLAAFDHRHIFLDPNPNPKASYKERNRLFELAASSWEDYDPKLISEGGGVYKRSSKAIPLTRQVQEALGIAEDKKSLTPNELIKAILKAPVDLFFNGGIGTFVKASTESHADVGDKTNEYSRINASELRCKVVGEGGNLGFTQLARVEFSLLNGFINSDFIDNSAGVDCSDHEVNIKILLNNEVDNGNLSEKERNKILATMTQDVGDLVLKDNYNQALVLSVAHYLGPQQISVYTNYINDLEISGVLNRELEFLPDVKKLSERKSAGLGLTRPELAVLMAYTKIYIKNAIINSDMTANKLISQEIFLEFPNKLQKNFTEAIHKHSLSKEIIATQLSNRIVNEMGIVFVYNLQTETGASIPEIARAFYVASKIFDGVELQHIIESLDCHIPYTMQYELLGYVRNLMYLSTRWFIRNINLSNDNMQKIIEHYAQSVKAIADLIPALMGGTSKIVFGTLSKTFASASIPEEHARKIAGTKALYTSLNIIQVATENRLPLVKTSEMYFKVGEQFNLLWFRDVIAKNTLEGYWETKARFALRDELDLLQKQLTVNILQSAKRLDTEEAIKAWVDGHQREINCWKIILEKLHSSTSLDNSMLFIALRELYSLINVKE